MGACGAADIRDVYFRNISKKLFRAVLTAERAGILSGLEDAYSCVGEIGIQIEICKAEGSELSHGERFANFVGSPKQIALAEEKLIGALAKASGIATAARTAVQLADDKIRIVSGSWKKMPAANKTMVRRAIVSGGASFRICDSPMLYIDKNFIRMMGSIPDALKMAGEFDGITKVIQIKGLDHSIAQETGQAVSGGADILMVDTGNTDDLETCLEALYRMNARERVQIAFAGNVRLTDIPDFTHKDVDILCIGKDIVDARLLDMRLDVVGEE